MKKLMINSLLLLGVWIIGTSPLLSVDWTQYTEPPCNPDPQHPWQGPKEMRICAQEAGLYWCDPACCFTIIFYDRWTGANNREYELNVVGLFEDNNPACNSCDYTSQTAFSGSYFKIISEFSKTGPGLEIRL